MPDFVVLLPSVYAVISPRYHSFTPASNIEWALTTAWTGAEKRKFLSNIAG